MSRAWHRCALIVGLAAAGCGASSAGPNAVRFWILPFENAAKDASLSYLSSALPELLTVFVSGTGTYSVVEREHLDRILAEHALSAEGLIAPARRNRIGRLLGATAMITGSYAREGRELIVTASATDVASGRVLASAQVAGSEDRLGETMKELHQELVRGLGDVPPGPKETKADPAPLQNLHFLRGLSFFYAARYHQALAEFIECGRDGKRDGLPGLWRANCYLAREEYDHAYLELIRLKREAPGAVGVAELEGKLDRCLAQLPPGDVQVYDRLVSPGMKNR